jgi:hypothetical protein
MWKSLGKVPVAAAGTPARLTVNETDPGATLLCYSIMVQQIRANTGYLIIGTASMDSSTHAGCLAVLAIPTTNSLPSANAGILTQSQNQFNAADYWLDATVNGEGGLVSVLVDG